MRRPLVRRTRLLSRLDEAVGAGLSVVSAPPGFGKTALVLQFVDGLDYNVRWIDVSAACASPEPFAQHLASAIVGPDAPFPAAIAGKLTDLKAYVDAAIRQASWATDQPLCIVVDNVHYLSDSPESVELLEWLFDRLPQDAELIISGRETIPSRVFDRRIAGGLCLLIEKEDLTFTIDEVEALIAIETKDNSRPELTPDAVSVFDRSGGWPIGAAAIISGAWAPERLGRSAERASWERYLAGDVWSSVPVELKRPMQLASVAPALDEALAIELMGATDWQRLNDWLDRHDFVFEYLPNSQMRVNPLLRGYQAGIFQREDPEAFDAAVVTICAHLEAHGAIAEAMEAAREWQHYDALTGLLERQGPALLYQGSLTLLGRAYDGLPAPRRNASPMVAAVRARVLAQQGEVIDALAEADRVANSADSDAEARLQALLARERALRYTGRVDQEQQVFDDLREMTADASALDRAEVAFAEAEFAMWVAGELQQASEALVRCIGIAQEASAYKLELLARSTLGQLNAMRGNGPAAVEELVRAASGWRTVASSGNLGWTLNNLGMAYLLVGDFHSALTTLTEAVSEGKRGGNPRNQAYATASLGDSELALGNYERARDRYSEALRLCTGGIKDDTLESLSLAGMSATLLNLGSENISQADYWVERALTVSRERGSPFDLATCLMQKGLIESALGTHDMAIERMKAATTIFTIADSGAGLRLAHYRLAMCYFAADRKADADAALRDLAGHCAEAWMFGSLLGAVRERPLFAQWAASRNVLGMAFKSIVAQHAFEQPEESQDDVASFPDVEAWSLGRLEVQVDGHTISDEQWASTRAKELFYLFLANPDGLRKEEAVESIYPDLPREKCNSAFHSNLYRIRKALYPDSIIKRNGTYLLNPEGSFKWDVTEFETKLERALTLEPASDERANAFRNALQLYRGPFAEAFFSEWAASQRSRLANRTQEALSVLAGYYAGKADYEAAADCMQKLLEADRFNEEAAYQLASYRVQGGNRAAALAFLDEYRRGYESEYGAGIPGRFTQLRGRIAAGAAI
ncbi:hypothetical protein AYO38_09920 [bacterium SCGC AG-212-C10]|nr:hypothetical protein AYO38_09920 [bacterium SCGC AG-212-C10]